MFEEKLKTMLMQIFGGKQRVFEKSLLYAWNMCFYQILQKELAAVDGYDAYFTRFR